MSRRNLLVLVMLALAFVAGQWMASAPWQPGPVAGPAEALAQGTAPLGDGLHVGTDGPNAYLWRYVEGEQRIVLVGRCSTIEGGAGAQAFYVWYPGVERTE